LIVIPMAGLSRRFAAAGYAIPKYMLPLGNGTVFDQAIGSFRRLFESERFLFIARDEAGTAEFIHASCETLGLMNINVEILNAPTAGQAETVEAGLIRSRVSNDEPITIFNIDTFRPGFRFPTAGWWSSSDGYLEVFHGTGSNWSYVRPAPHGDNLVAQTAEKQPISKMCCTGLYHFTRARDFMSALERERERPSSSELFVAPLYNHLISAGARVHYWLVPLTEIVFCGVPSEYEALRSI
jgi:hypothetical protein